MSASASQRRPAPEPGRADLVNPWASDADTARIKSNPAFVELQRKRGSFGWTLTVLMLLIYYGFVFLVAFAPGQVGLRVAGSMTLGLLLGLGVIVSAVVLTGVYVLRANGEFDRLQAQVVRDAGGAGGRVR